MSPLLQWRRKLKSLRHGVDAQIDAELRKIAVPPAAARTLVTRLQTELLNPSDGKAWNGRIRTSVGALTESQDNRTEIRMQFNKAKFLKPSEEEFRQTDIQQWARQFAWLTVPFALDEALRINGIKPIGGSSGGEKLLNLAAAIRAERWSGRTPAVLVPRGPTGHLVDEMHWQIGGRSGPPVGVEFSRRESTEGPFAYHMVNGALVFNMQTQGDKIYLVPAAWFDCLVFEQQVDGTVLQHEVHVEEPDTVVFQLRWRAELSGAFHQTKFPDVRHTS